MADAKELQANLTEYRAQFRQVEAALTTDPDNDELIKLKQDLQEVINLTLDLLKVNEKTVIPSAALKWKVGQKCQAVWSQDGSYYDATIDSISEDFTTCTVSFEKYGNTEIVKVSSLREKDQAGSSAPKRVAETSIVAAPSTSKKSRADEDALREQKKKKMMKKKQRAKELEEQREKDKQNWLDFLNNSKGGGSSKSGKSLKGVSKKSIFASPESIQGKVGVGTCGIGGQPMTQFTQPDKLVYKR
ncbi:survival of motor neuron-related-splicing factor 30-like [Stylophora pistillata]|uniref:Survival of motor neuron-related-splicing factor 30 n=1 Tax=Stylophora pistillata TaxID=50429 RepID=A0A2B4RBS7_STYPI|nr:survival of motor neuron-related-splicing factor 30-like [Stylophora pistillata]PFX14249.1 Survival of motor neuron-related-splicing factor 30 [Stylophora pistillata]